MSSIKLKHSSGNGVSISAPDTNPSSDRTLKLPSIDADGIVATKDSSDNLVSVSGMNGGQLSNRNLIGNGDFLVAQRGTSSTTAGYTTVDRFKCQTSSVDEAPTQAQVDVASGTTPYSLGFRKAFKITNGNQTSGAGAGDLIKVQTAVEAQDVAASGWNYTSSTSYISLQFWVKSSIAQNFYFNLITRDGTISNYAMETGSLVANTWTKVTKKIPGATGLQFDNDNDEGLRFEFTLFRGTDSTGTRPLNAWAALDSTTRMPDNTTTWYTTNDATFEITGVQLEVGDTPTAFEHLKFVDSLQQCQRYCFRDGTDKFHYSALGSIEHYEFPVQMRVNPTVTLESAPTGATVNRARPCWVTITGMGSNSGNIKVKAEAEFG